MADFSIADFGPRGRGNFSTPFRGRRERPTTQELGPEDIQRPQVARDPGVTAKPSTVTLAQVIDPRGEALSAFSKDMAAVGVAFNALYEKRKAAEDAIGVDHGQLLLNQNFEPVIREKLSSPETARPDFITKLDERLGEVQEETFKALEEKGVALSPEGRKKLEHAAMGLRVSAARRAAAGANNQRVAHLQLRTEENVGEIARIAGASGDIDDAFARVDSTIEAVSPVLAPDKFKTFREKARTLVLEAAIEGYIRRGRPDKAQELVDRFTGFVKADEAPKGLLEPGNIDLNTRPIVQLPDGKIATVKSMSVNFDGKEVLIPTIADDGKILNEEQAVKLYQSTGKHLGKFDTPANATAFAKSLSDRQGSSITRVIAETAKAEGVDPAVALAIASIESKFNPKAKNPDSSAGGLFQFISDTGTKFGLPPDAREASVEEQARAGARLTAENTASLRRAFGAEPTPTELYLAHFLGASTAIRLLKAEPGTKVADILTPEQIKANKFVAGWDASQVFDWARGRMNEGLAEAGNYLSGRTIGANAADVPMKEAMRLGHKVSKATIGERGRLRILINDDIASIRRTGEGVQVDGNAAVRILPPGEMETWQEKREDARTYYDATNDMGQVDGNELRRRAAILEPTAGEAGFARKLKLFQDVSKEAEFHIELRKTDPAKSVAEDPEVREAAKGFDPQNTETWKPIIFARLAAQEKIGIPEAHRTPITKDEALQLIDPLRRAMPGQERKVLRDLGKQFETMFGSYADEAFKYAVGLKRLDEHSARTALSIIKKLSAGDMPTRDEARELDQGAEIKAAEDAVGAPSFSFIPSEKRGLPAPQFPAPRPQSNILVPPGRAISALRADPTRATEFDEKFGKGAAKMVLDAYPVK